MLVTNIISVCITELFGIVAKNIGVTSPWKALLSGPQHFHRVHFSPIEPAPVHWKWWNTPSGPPQCAGRALVRLPNCQLPVASGLRNLTRRANTFLPLQVTPGRNPWWRPRLRQIGHKGQAGRREDASSKPSFSRFHQIPCFLKWLQVRPCLILIVWLKRKPLYQSVQNDWHITSNTKQSEAS